MISTAAAVALYGLPIAVLWIARARRERSLWEIALDVPLAVVVDLLVVLALARIVILADAVLLARGGWLAYGVARVAWRCRSGHAPRWPASMDRESAGAALAAAAASACLSLLRSRDFTIWDRRWHIPLAASLGGQRVPFHNVFQPDMTLHYHFTGDVIAAELQALSGSVTNASLALSLAHDVMFGLTGLTFALLLRAFGARHSAAAPLGALSLLLVGPFTLWTDAHHFHGYSCLGYLQMSFRPHVCLAGLLIVGFIGALAVGENEEARRAVPRTRTLVPLLASGLGLSLTDETSLGLIGLSAGSVWLLRPRALHDNRWIGLAWLVVLAVGALALNRAFGGSLAPGGPVQGGFPFKPGMLVAYEGSVHSLHEHLARRLFLYDFSPTLAVLAALVWAAGAGLVRGSAGLVVFSLAVTASALFGLTSITTWETHRFATAPMFAVPAVSMLLLARAPPGTLQTTLMQLGLGAGAVSAIAYGWAGLERDGEANSSFGKFDLYTADCRSETDARPFERTTPRYIEPSMWFLWAGCHPSFMPGSSNGWTLKTEGPVGGLPALRELDAEVGWKPLEAICPGGLQTDDTVCHFAVAQGLCAPSGTAAQRCRLTRDDRQRILSPGATQP